MVLIIVSCHDLQENHFPSIELNRFAVTNMNNENADSYLWGWHVFGQVWDLRIQLFADFSPQGP